MKLLGQDFFPVSYGPKPAKKVSNFPKSNTFGPLRNLTDPSRWFLYSIFNVETRKTGPESSNCPPGELRSETTPHHV